MILTINRLDYSGAVDSATGVTIERRLNAPSECAALLLLPRDGSLPVPARFEPVCVTGDDGAVYFTGYVDTAALPEYVGEAEDGPRYRYRVRALSDEMLLDQAIASGSRGMCGTTAAAAMSNLVAHTGSAQLSAAGLQLDVPLAQFRPGAAAPFSRSAGEVADQARAAYRAQAGALSLDSIPVRAHALREDDGSFLPANLRLVKGKRELANDITVCGAHEPGAYVAEVFAGDGITNSFPLSTAPWFAPASDDVLLNDQFDRPSIDTTMWSNASAAAYFSIGDRGLAMHGGSGVPGEARLAWIGPVEIGGTLVLEAQGLTLENGSTGLLAALLTSAGDEGTYFAGFEAIAEVGTGAVSIQPVVQGAGAGPVFLINPMHEYTLRLRVHCAEPLRRLQTYLGCGDHGVISSGGQSVTAPARLQMEIQECVDGVLGMPVVVYEGWVDAAPAACTVVAADSVNLHGSLRSIRLSSLGSAWVLSTSAGGVQVTRRLGTPEQSAECAVSRNGVLTFFPGFTPAAGERITVNYREVARSVGRAVDGESQQALAESGFPATIAWSGTVTRPLARCSADCRNAAAVMAETAAGSSSRWGGTYRGTNFDLPADVWPGDALAITAPSCTVDSEVVVRHVKLTCRMTMPELVTYEIGFANDWAEDLAIGTSAAVPADAWLPAAVNYRPTANLSGLAVVSVVDGTVTLNANASAPSGGGFEVRTRDHAFGPDQSSSLVLRGSQPDMTFTRQAAADRFYVRMFDGATPPNYSEFSALVVLNLPLAG